MDINRQAVAVRSLDGMIAAAEDRKDVEAVVQFRIQRALIIDGALSQLAELEAKIHARGDRQ